jgi:hypothetical protein
MSDKSLLSERLNARKSESDDREEMDEFGCYAVVRGIRDRCPMVEFIHPSGDSVAFPYADLTRLTWSKNSQLDLQFNAVVVQIRGKQLAKSSAGLSLHSALKLHRVPWVKAVDEMKLAQDNPDAATVTSIRIEGIVND